MLIGLPVSWPIDPGPRFLAAKSTGPECKHALLAIPGSDFWLVGSEELLIVVQLLYCHAASTLPNDHVHQASADEHRCSAVPDHLLSGKGHTINGLGQSCKSNGKAIFE